MTHESSTFPHRVRDASHLPGSLGGDTTYDRRLVKGRKYGILWRTLLFFSGKKLIQLPYSSFVPKKRRPIPESSFPPRLTHLPAGFLWDVAWGCLGSGWIDLQTFFHETMAPKNGQNGVPFTLATTCPMPHQHPPLTKSQGDNSVFCGPTRFHGWWWCSPWKWMSRGTIISGQLFLTSEMLVRNTAGMWLAKRDWSFIKVKVHEVKEISGKIPGRWPSADIEQRRWHRITIDVSHWMNCSTNFDT